MVSKCVYMHVHCWPHSHTYFLNDTYSDTYYSDTYCFAQLFILNVPFCVNLVPIPRISLQPSGYLQGVVGEMQDIICAVTITSTIDSDSVEMTWINADSIITADNRVTIITNITENPFSFTYITIIQFTYLMEGDEGNYICSVEADDMMESRSIILENLRSMPKLVTY